MTISKAGIHASLNARCSVLAAANPVYGRYDQYKTPMENIGLQDSLLSRFDLLFVMLDTVDNELDEVIADHVVRMHRYRNPKEQDGDVLPMGSSVDMLTTFNTESSDKQASIYERYDPLLHGGSRKKSDQVLSVDFMRKYINIAKCMKPKLTQQACELISSEYSRLRSQELADSDMARTQPVTARSLETLIRLATAHAKARMAKTVTAADAEAAIELVQFAYFKKVLEKEKKKRRRASSDMSEGEEHGDEEVTTSEGTTQRTKRARQTAAVIDSEDEDEEMPAAVADVNDLTVRSSIQDPRPSTSTVPDSVETPSLTSMDDARFKMFKNGLQKLFRETRQQSLSMTQVVEYINKESGDETLTQNEINFALHRMTEDNQIMVADDFVILI